VHYEDVICKSENCKQFVSEPALKPTGDEAASCSEVVCRLRWTILKNGDQLMKVSRSTLRLAGIALLIAASLTLGGCGDPESQTAPIALMFDETVYPLPTSLASGSTAAVEVTVVNDNQNAGVTFSCTPTGECGTFTPPSTGSNVPSCYQTPAAVPSGGKVTITATSKTDPTKSVSSMPITISTIDPVSGCTP
jgi:hypothetical protein